MKIEYVNAEIEEFLDEIYDYLLDRADADDYSENEEMRLLVRAERARELFAKM